MSEWIIGGGLVAILSWVLKLFWDRGANKNVEEKVQDLAAKKSELLEKQQEMSDLKYAQRKESLEADEKRLKEQIKNKEDIDVPDTEVDDADASELAERLSEYTD